MYYILCHCYLLGHHFSSYRLQFTSGQWHPQTSPDPAGIRMETMMTNKQPDDRNLALVNTVKVNHNYSPVFYRTNHPQTA